MLTHFFTRCSAILRLVRRWKFFNVAVIVAFLGTVGTMYDANRTHDVGVRTVQAGITVARVQRASAADVARIQGEYALAVARVQAEAQRRSPADTAVARPTPAGTSPRLGSP